MPAASAGVSPSLIDPCDESTLAVAPPRATLNEFWMLPPGTSCCLSSSYWINNEPAVTEPVAPLIDLSLGTSLIVRPDLARAWARAWLIWFCAGLDWPAMCTPWSSTVAAWPATFRPSMVV